ncbi:MAG: efflux transporter periplasmic adaptor subunit [Methylotenera sp. RIFCSPLOWO2_02_FULL_45_14]|nr:MAG: efflux transporter periplasmic adaptor subunit [Methylotenera sp. RIFCSPLOWO2_02_FULL_45_14]
MHKITQSILLTLFLSLLVACGANDKSTGKSGQEKQGPKPTLITVTQVQNKSIEITEEAIGSLEGLIDPTIAAEVAARVIKVYVSPGQTVKQGQLIATLDATDFGLQRNEAQAEVARIEALLDNQAKTVVRSQALVNKKFISQNVVDNELAQQNVLKEQLTGAKARVSTINHSSSKTKVFAPASGVVEKKIVDTGEFVKVGDPIVQIISNKRLRAHIPFPERISAQLKPGLKVRLSTPTSTQVVESVIRELKSMITESNRTVDVIADVTNQLDWQPGASVTGTVILGERPNAMMVPEQSVVLRPAGEVVYVVKADTAHQVIVKTGLHQNRLVEIIDGLNANDTIASDGAGFLTDKAPVKIASDHLTQ